MQKQINNLKMHQRIQHLPGIHKLKIHNRFYEKLVSGQKKVEIRYNDRNYQKGDILYFNQISTDYTDYMESRSDNVVFGEVTHQEKSMVTLFVITDVTEFPNGLKDGYVALSLALFSVGINRPAIAASNNYVDREAVKNANIYWRYIQGFLHSLNWV